MRKSLIVLLLLLATPVFATTWQEANKASVAALNSGNADEAVKLGQQAMDLYLQLPAFKAETYSNLALNLVDINLNREDYAAAGKVLDRAIDMIAEKSGKQSTALIALYRQKGTLGFYRGNFKHIENAYAEAYKIAIVKFGAADIRSLEFLMATADAAKQFGYTSDVEEYLSRAWKAVSALPANDNRRLYVEVNRAKYALERGDDSDAQRQYESIVEQLRAQAHPDPVMLRAVCGQLAYLYSKQGREADADRVVMYTSVLPFPEDQPQPLVRVMPEDPRKYGDGRARIRFTVDRRGRVANPVVVESVGNVQFRELALDAIKDWRYQPRSVGGQIVEVSGVEVVFSLQWMTTPGYGPIVKGRGSRIPN